MQSFLSIDRERLGISQKKAFEVAGVNKATYYRWEQGSPIPSDKLALLSELGFDINFVVTGQRTGANGQVSPKVNVNTKRLQDSVEIVFNVLELLRKTGDGMSAARSAELAVMIYERLEKGQQFGADEVELLLKLAS